MPKADKGCWEEHEPNGKWMEEYNGIKSTQRWRKMTPDHFQIEGPDFRCVTFTRESFEEIQRLKLRIAVKAEDDSAAYYLILRYPGKPRKVVPMYRWITKTPDSRRRVHYLDYDRMHNCEANLQLCERSATIRSCSFCSPRLPRGVPTMPVHEPSIF
jgi:hypothetical protein